MTEIEKAIKDNPDGRITVTVGNSHKYWLNNRLKSYDGVNLEHIQRYLKCAETQVNNRIELT